MTTPTKEQIEHIAKIVHLALHPYSKSTLNISNNGMVYPMERRILLATTLAITEWEKIRNSPK